ncbi:MAG: hypothetical protein WB721_25260, partial [Pseudolabrys sp.]
MQLLCLAASACRRGIAYAYHGDIELKRHPGEWVIGIDHHEAVLLVDLGDHLAVKTGALGLSATDAFGQSLPVADDNLRRL